MKSADAIPKSVLLHGLVFSCLYEKALTVWTGKCSLCHSRVGGNPA
ncbi:MAG TPA: hypothetical protein LFV92_00635 [Rickettsia endosymbiont of Ceroptres masudai]|nr:hypothetical protein [Rickettsia endosymbiont of Ceroptres masudai]